NLYLTIEYASMSYTAYANSRDINVGRAGIINVNDFSGTVRLMREDLGIGGNIMPVSISLVYDENNLSLPDDLA
ncbi:MAG: hypothetical protein Q4D35_04470, partial [Ruminococcus sp.]|nr:hypothetical protein [Ruminococcus sp.]